MTAISNGRDLIAARNDLIARLQDCAQNQDTGFVEAMKHLVTEMLDGPLFDPAHQLMVGQAFEAFLRGPGTTLQACDWAGIDPEVAR